MLPVNAHSALVHMRTNSNQTNENAFLKLWRTANASTSAASGKGHDDLKSSVVVGSNRTRLSCTP